MIFELIGGEVRGQIDGYFGAIKEDEFSCWANYGQGKWKVKALGSTEGEILKSSKGNTSDTGTCDNFTFEAFTATDHRKEILKREKSNLDFSADNKESNVNLLNSETS